jgi:glycerate 2-kinase
MPSPRNLRNDAVTIWQAGVDAVRSERLIQNVLQLNEGILTVCGQSFPVAQFEHIAVVGAGKAGAGMAAAIEEIFGPEFVDSRVSGWINVPADCVRPLRGIHLHAARPAGVNEPTEAGVVGSQKILEIVSKLGPADLCLVLISGGGSALLPAPISQISLADKQAVTRFLMQAGATIFELNAVRKQLSEIKGGGLARAIHAGTALALIISDVVGDPLDVIASGPTVVDSHTPTEALNVLRKFGAKPPAVPQAVFSVLERTVVEGGRGRTRDMSITNYVIGNNAVAASVASARAIEMGYEVRALGSDNQGEASEVGREMAELCLSIRDELIPNSSPVCLVSGGEPVVHLNPIGPRGKGGRNQQLVLSAVDRLWDENARRLAILSGGTDGEDGPTDAAGACADAELLKRARVAGLAPRDFLERNDAYRFFDQVGGLIRTGPTHTNVMDLRIALIGVPTAAG